MRHRIDGVRRDARRLDLPHDDGHRSRAGCRVHAGSRAPTSSRSTAARGMDMERARQAVIRYHEVTGLPVMAQPNAGQPKLVEMKVVYDETPEQMVGGVVPLLEAGATSSAAAAAARRITFARFGTRWTRGYREVPTPGVSDFPAKAGSYKYAVRFRTRPVASGFSRKMSRDEMKQRLCDVNTAATEKLPQHTDDKSGIGVHYVDAYLKPMNGKLEDGTSG